MYIFPQESSDATFYVYLKQANQNSAYRIMQKCLALALWL